MAKIDLDSFGKDPKKQKKAVVKPSDTIGPVDLVIASRQETEKVKPKVPVAPKGRSLEEIYDSASRVIYLFDVSGSMGEPMPGAKKSVDDYIWDEATIASIRSHVEESVKQIADPNSQDYPDESEAVERARRYSAMVGMTDDQLKQGVIDSGMIDEIYVPTNWLKSRSNSKLGMVRQVAQKMVRRRYEKYPNALVGAFMFSDEVYPMPFDDEAGLLKAIEEMHTVAGTRIMDAINAALSACKRAPSPVNLHHLILVSDGLDNRAIDIVDKIPEFKALGILLDFIHIPSVHEYEGRYTSVIEAIRKACSETGGEYTVVRTAEEFELKFIAASFRLMLPPPAAE